MPAPELQAGDALSNPQEARMVKQIVLALQAGGVALQDIGVISPYRSQVSIASLLRHSAWRAPPVAICMQGWQQWCWY